MGKIWDWLTGKEPAPPPPLDVVAMYETRTAGMCTLAPQVSAWKTWLDRHTEEVEAEQGEVVTHVEHLGTIKAGFEGLEKSIGEHVQALESTRETMENLLGSFEVQPDPSATDVIGVHEANLTNLHQQHQESLDRMLAVAEEEIGKMNSRKEKVTTELTEVKSKLERLHRSKETLDAEKDVTESFKKNIAAFIVSKIAPPKSGK